MHCIDFNHSSDLHRHKSQTFSQSLMLHRSMRRLKPFKPLFLSAVCTGISFYPQKCCASRMFLCSLGKTASWTRVPPLSISRHVGRDLCFSIFGVCLLHKDLKYLKGVGGDGDSCSIPSPCHFDIWHSDVVDIKESVFCHRCIFKPPSCRLKEPRKGNSESAPI